MLESLDIETGQQEYEMSTVPESRLKGNYGAAVVMARLGSECLVRPVAVDTDVGIDLYCETVAEGRPFLHFWIQVKAGDQCELNSAANSASCRFKRDQLAYWDRQPVPVFAALVPTDWPVRGEPDVYIVDITTWILFTDLLPSQQSFMLSSHYHWPAGDRESVRSFLTKVVPDTTARLQISRGVVASSPTPTPQYVYTTPPVPVTRFRKQILHQLRTTAANSIFFALAIGEPTAEDKEFLRLMACIVGQFGDDPHWENFMARALVSHANEDYESALPMYEKARKSIEGDPQVRDEPFWQERVHTIQCLEERARGRQLIGVVRQ